MLSSNLLNISLILTILKEKIKLSSYQFGFENNTPTVDAALIFKETIHHHTNCRKSQDCAININFSETFDNVEFFELGKVLLKWSIWADLLLLLTNE